MKRNSILFIFGFIAYPLMEIAYRGRSHISMAFTGGFIVAFLYQYHLKNRDASIIKKGAVGTLTITAAEFVVGVFVNIILGLNVWDYSHLPLNLFGQVCLTFSIIWFFLSMVLFLLYYQADRVFEQMERGR